MSCKNWPIKYFKLCGKPAQLYTWDFFSCLTTSCIIIVGKVLLRVEKLNGALHMQFR